MLQAQAQQYSIYTVTLNETYSALPEQLPSVVLVYLKCLEQLSPVVLVYLKCLHARPSEPRNTPFPISKIYFAEGDTGQPARTRSHTIKDAVRSRCLDTDAL